MKAKISLIGLALSIAVTLLFNNSVRADDPLYEPLMMVAPKIPFSLPTDDWEPEPKPNTGFFGLSMGTYGVPVNGYPGHSGLIAGLNDTLEISIYVYNKTTSPIDIQYYSIETWFKPVVWASYSDAMHKQRALADSSDLGYRFSHWENSNGAIARPTVLPTSNKARERMVFLIWNLPQGVNTIELVPNSSCPSTFFKLIRNSMGVYWLTPAKSAKDSINAYVHLYTRASDREDYTRAMMWVDSILGIEDSSMVGWLEKGYLHDLQGDTTNAIAAYDRVESIYKNQSDPLIFQQVEDLNFGWAYEQYKLAIQSRWVIRTGRELILY